MRIVVNGKNVAIFERFLEMSKSDQNEREERDQIVPLIFAAKVVANVAD